MNNPDTLTTTGTILEGDAGKIARINRMQTLLGDMKAGIQSGEDVQQEMAKDAYKILREARELAQEMSK